LYQITGDRRYLDTAHMIFRSFLLFNETPYLTNDWISYVDDEGYYWIEEYPRNVPDHVLNGFQYAVLGLHKYWMLTHNTVCEFLIKASLATISKYALDYRNEGWISSKRLRNNNGEREKYLSMVYKYHLQHIILFRQLYLISGDPSFKNAADLFESDRMIFDQIKEDTGALMVTIFPKEAINQGAAWRRANTSKLTSAMDQPNPKQWYGSGSTESYIVPGIYKVQFKPIGHAWKRPENINVKILSHQKVKISAKYISR
jgi:hypothetical protein